MRFSVAVLVVFMVLAVIPRSASPVGAVPARPEVTVSLGIVERGRIGTDGALHVIIANTSDQPDAKPQSHFDEWNSWGYDNVTLEWKDAEGHWGTVTKAPRELGMEMLPTTTDLKPGDALVREISFDPKVWRGWPTFTDRLTRYTLKVTYRSTGDPKVPEARGWTGSVASKEQIVDIYRPRTP